jgi:hypothetical protein
MYRVDCLFSGPSAALQCDCVRYLGRPVQVNPIRYACQAAALHLLLHFLQLPVLLLLLLPLLTSPRTAAKTTSLQPLQLQMIVCVMRLLLR